MAMGLDHRQMFQLPAGTGRGGGRGVEGVTLSSRHGEGWGAWGGRSDPWKEGDSGGGCMGEMDRGNTSQADACLHFMNAWSACSGLRAHRPLCPRPWQESRPKPVTRTGFRAGCLGTDPVLGGHSRLRRNERF